MWTGICKTDSDVRWAVSITFHLIIEEKKLKLVHQTVSSITDLTHNYQRLNHPRGRDELMILGSVGYGGKIALQFIDRQLNPVRYVNMLRNENYVTEDVQKNSQHFMFQKDNTSIYAWTLILQLFLQEQDIKALVWLANSSDFNITNNGMKIVVREGFWRWEAIMVQKLKTAFSVSWDKVHSVFLHHLDQIEFSDWLIERLINFNPSGLKIMYIVSIFIFFV